MGKIGLFVDKKRGKNPQGAAKKTMKNTPEGARGAPRTAPRNKGKVEVVRQ